MPSGERGDFIGDRGTTQPMREEAAPFPDPEKFVLLDKAGVNT